MSGAEVVEPPIEQLCELDRRSNNGVDVMLVWEPATNRIFVGVIDQRTGNEFAMEVDPAKALDAFYHPFAYEGYGAPETAPEECVGAEV
ncbi:MAG TPA: hypothetical protein VNH40_08995 [Gaiellaceae bacterium]|nr:hypothetical protein [Gaiellaceae bacterium]